MLLSHFISALYTFGTDNQRGINISICIVEGWMGLIRRGMDKDRALKSSVGHLVRIQVNEDPVKTP
jgi:hypothetical protein